MSLATLQTYKTIISILYFMVHIFNYHSLARYHNFQLGVEPTSNLNFVTLETIITRANESLKNSQLGSFRKVYKNISGLGKVGEKLSGEGDVEKRVQDNY